MELDVHITREGDEPWGFEFVGGAGCHLPLTIDKVLLYSPAHAAGLQAGDMVARLGDRLAADLTQHEALQIVGESVASLSFGICRGLYDPVLDDFEPIYEPIDRADSDLRSEPTEEYIREIERKSSLLASAIDQTIKSIEEYKEDVGIHTKNDVAIQLSNNTKTRAGTIQNGFTNGHEQNGLEKELSEEMKEGTQEASNEMSKAKDSMNGAKKRDELPGFKPIVFNPEDYQARLYEEVIRGTEPSPVEVKLYVDESGAPLGTVKGIVDGLEDAIVDEEVAKELGKPGLTEDKIAELISGETEMLREAHVMGLSRVLTSHMTRPDDSSVDFQKIKPLYESLKDSEVLKALNEEMKRENEEKKKKEEKKWTTFLQKPKRPVPRVKFGYYGQVETEDVENEEQYKVKIVKQPKPKVAPDYKPEDFETGPLPWEQRALIEPVPSPVPPEEPILVPEEAEFFEAVDPLPETEVPDLEDTGILLPPTPPPEIPTDLPPEPQDPPDLLESEPEVQEEEPPPMPDMDQTTVMAEQLVNTIKSMVDPNAPLEQQLCQMRAQLAALAQLPCVIQQSLELLTQQLVNMGQETHPESHQEVRENNVATIQEEKEQLTQNNQEELQNHEKVVQNGQDGTQKEEGHSTVTIEEVQEETPTMSAGERAALKKKQDALIEEQKKSEKDKKERQEQIRFDQESRQLKQRAPRVGKPRPVFGPLNPEDRPQVLPGGRRWKGPKDAYDEQWIAETLQAQSELIQGKVMGYESDRLPYDNRSKPGTGYGLGDIQIQSVESIESRPGTNDTCSINFMKYEKPPVSLDHLQNSATYRLVHNIEDAPLKRTDLRTPVISEADYRERCRSATPNVQATGRM